MSVRVPIRTTNAHPSVAATILLAAVILLASGPAMAGTRPQVDLSETVSTTPVPFEPGGIVTMTMTVYNAGPDTAGAVLPNIKEIIVYEKGYNVVDQPPPYDLFEPAVGCSAYAEYSEYNPSLPGGGIALLHSYYFDAIAPGESRTCINRVQFLPSTQESFATNWRVNDGANDDDINPGNDRFDYVFQAPAAPVSAPIPTLSGAGWLMLVSGLLAIAWRMRKYT